MVVHDITTGEGGGENVLWSFERAGQQGKATSIAGLAEEEMNIACLSAIISYPAQNGRQKGHPALCIGGSC